MACKREHSNATSPIMVMIILLLSSGRQITFYFFFNLQEFFDFHSTNDVELTSEKVK